MFFTLKNKNSTNSKQMIVSSLTALLESDPKHTFVPEGTHLTQTVTSSHVLGVFWADTGVTGKIRERHKHWAQPGNPGISLPVFVTDTLSYCKADVLFLACWAVESHGETPHNITHRYDSHLLHYHWWVDDPNSTLHHLLRVTNKHRESYNTSLH